jgi:hypothetical protein
VAPKEEVLCAVSCITALVAMLLDPPAQRDARNRPISSPDISPFRSLSPPAANSLEGRHLYPPVPRHQDWQAIRAGLHDLLKRNFSLIAEVGGHHGSESHLRCSPRGSSKRPKTTIGPRRPRSTTSSAFCFPTTAARGKGL